jgi:hypothetical protein
MCSDKLCDGVGGQCRDNSDEDPLKCGSGTQVDGLLFEKELILSLTFFS